MMYASFCILMYFVFVFISLFNCLFRPFFPIFTFTVFFFFFRFLPLFPFFRFSPLVLFLPFLPRFPYFSLCFFRFLFFVVFTFCLSCLSFLSLFSVSFFLGAFLKLIVKMLWLQGGYRFKHPHFDIFSKTWHSSSKSGMFPPIQLQFGAQI